MRILNDIDLNRKIVWRNVYVLSQFANGVNTEGGFVTAIDVNDVGRVSRKNFAAGWALQAGQSFVSILLMLANQSGGKVESQGVLSKTTLARKNIGVR